MLFSRNLRLCCYISISKYLVVFICSHLITSHTQIITNIHPMITDSERCCSPKKIYVVAIINIGYETSINETSVELLLEMAKFNKIFERTKVISHHRKKKSIWGLSNNDRSCTIFHLSKKNNIQKNRVCAIPMTNNATK